MIKISSRDTFALFGDEFANRYELENIRGYENYTKDKVRALTNMFFSGELESRPSEKERAYFVEWTNRMGATHRIGGPAVEWEDGKSEWWINNKLHREDGPAFIDGDHLEWHLDGEEYSKEGYEKTIESGDIPRP